MERFEMLEIMKKRLPEGLEIVKVKNQSNRNQAEITFSYKGYEVKEWLTKTCTPGHEEKNCDQTIFNAMAMLAIKRNDFETAKYWSDKILNS